MILKISNKNVLDTVNILNNLLKLSDTLDPKLKILAKKNINALENFAKHIEDEVADIKVKHAMSDPNTRCVLYENMEKGIYKYSTEGIIAMNQEYRKYMDIESEYEVAVLPEDKCPINTLHFLENDTDEIKQAKFREYSFKVSVYDFLKKVGIIETTEQVLDDPDFK